MSFVAVVEKAHLNLSRFNPVLKSFRACLIELYRDSKMIHEMNKNKAMGWTSRNTTQRPKIHLALHMNTWNHAREKDVTVLFANTILEQI